MYNLKGSSRKKLSNKKKPKCKRMFDHFILGVKRDGLCLSICEIVYPIFPWKIILRKSKKILLFVNHFTKTA